jgi:hypothetical protein
LGHKPQKGGKKQKKYRIKQINKQTKQKTKKIRMIKSWDKIPPNKSLKENSKKIVFLLNITYLKFHGRK